MLLDETDKEGIDYQLTPAGAHQRNVAKKAVCTMDPDFPLDLWDKLKPQAEITLNLLRPSCINPNLSAYSQLHGHIDYNRMSMAPPGLKILTHIQPKNRSTWNVQAKNSFYIGLAMKHYWCQCIWLTKTQAEQIAQTIKWLLHKGLDWFDVITNLLHCSGVRRYGKMVLKQVEVNDSCNGWVVKKVFVLVLSLNFDSMAHCVDVRCHNFHTSWRVLFQPFQRNCWTVHTHFLKVSRKGQSTFEDQGPSLTFPNRRHCIQFTEEFIWPIHKGSKAAVQGSEEGSS